MTQRLTWKSAGVCVAVGLGFAYLFWFIVGIVEKK